MQIKIEIWDGLVVIYFIISRKHCKKYWIISFWKDPPLFEWAFTWKFSTYETPLYKTINYVCIWFFSYNQGTLVSEIGSHYRESRFNFQYTWWLSRVISFSSTVTLKHYVPNYLRTHNFVLKMWKCSKHLFTRHDMSTAFKWWWFKTIM